MIASKFSFQLSLANEQDIPKLFALEAASFPSDEAASEETMRMRCRDANPYFAKVVNDSQDIVGFINGTCSKFKDIHHESMSLHDPDGPYLVIHSVTVAPAYRRCGLGLAMLQDYIEYIFWFRPEIKGVALLSKCYLLNFYMQAGFKVVQLSPVQHGQEAWYELSIALFAMRDSIFRFDAFTNQAFNGNPAAVLPRIRSTEDMSRIASELNCPVTAFIQLLPEKSAEDPFLLLPKSYRFFVHWFTPAQELPICGHGALACASFLYSTYHVPRSRSIEFLHAESEKTLVEATCRPSCIGRSDDCLEIEISFAARQLLTLEISEKETLALISAFGLSSKDEILFVWEDAEDLVIHLTSDAFIRVGLGINHSELFVFPHRRVCITCKRTQDFDLSIGSQHITRLFENGGSALSDVHFLVRVFLLEDIPVEDQVTGSVQRFLIPYWLYRLDSSKSCDSSILGLQCSQRGGLINGRIDNGVVYLFGYSTFFSDGSLTLTT